MEKRSALLISDDMTLSLQVSGVAQRAGLDVVTTASLERLATLRIPRPSAILLDVSPNRPLDRTAPRKLRELLRAPVILLATEADITLLRQAGTQADAYVRKPLEEEALRQALESALEDRSLESRLSESHQQYQVLFNAVPDAVFIHDKETHRFLDCNAAAVRTYGYTLDEFRRMTPFDLHPESEHAVIRQRLDVRNVDQPNAYTHLAKDGRRLDVEVRSDEILYLGRPAWVTIVRSMSGRAREQGTLDEGALHQQRIESIGRLAGGIAHDFNNLLTTILGHAALALRRVPDDSPIRRNLDVITQSGERASAVVSQLLAFGGRQQGKPEVLDLTDLISRTTHMLSRVLGESIELALESRKAAGLVSVDPVQIQQILVNLALNAREAMPGGGRVTFAVEPFEVTEEEMANLPGLVPGAHVRLRISDNGCGMDTHTLAHAFEPFFTSKPSARYPVASGRGMGLAIVHGLVRQNHGTIAVESRPGQGTSFDIYIPCASVEAETRVAETSERKTVLVVEDEKDLCALVHAVLSDRGYEVLLARQIEEAWEIARRYTGTIHLLLTDALLPDGHGPELAERLRRRRPGMGTICMSGHAPDFLAQQGIKLEGLTFLPKPFKIDELARLVKDALERPTPFRRHRPSERLQSPVS